MAVERPGNAEQKLEALLFDATDNLHTIETVGDSGEIVSSENKKDGQFGLIAVLTLSAVFILLVGTFFLLYKPLSPPPNNQLNENVSLKLPMPERPAETTGLDSTLTEKTDSSAKVPLTSPVAAAEIPLFSVIVGPFVSDVELQQALEWLQELGFKAQKSSGSGQVTMIRLLLGIYPEKEAKLQLGVLKEITPSAFVLPAGDKLAVYAGSFHQKDRALRMQDALAHQLINVNLIDSEVTMSGTMLTVLQADQKTAGEVAAHIFSLGLRTQMVEKK